MIYKTRGIVLRSVKYGETSMVTTLLTELFGLQTYMVNGVRTTKKSGNKAIMLQPASILDLEVYHHEQKNMQRIKEYQWAHLYESLLSDVLKNSIAAFIIELIIKTVRQPEKNEELFYFCEDILVQLDAAESNIAANFPLFFSLQLPKFFGFKIQHPPLHSPNNLYLDLTDGHFLEQEPAHEYFLRGQHTIITAELLKVMQPIDLAEIKLNREIRRTLLDQYLIYYKLHFPDFGEMRTLKVLEEIF